MDSKSKAEIKSKVNVDLLCFIIWKHYFSMDIDVKLFNESNHEKYTLVQTPTVYPEKYTKSR